MHILKQVVGELTTPLMLVVVLALVGWLLMRARRRRAALVVLVCAAVLAYLSTTGLLGRALLAPLERDYHPLQEAALPAVKYVVVLGSSYNPRERFPVTASLDYDALVRITEALRLMRKLSDAKLLLPGAVPGEVTPTNGYVLLAREMGIEEKRLIMIPESAPDTSTEARQIAAHVGREPFLLITSYDHMPRAMRLMIRADADPIPAPATLPIGPLSGADFLPRSRGLRLTELALHEYMGLAAIKFGLD